MGCLSQGLIKFNHYLYCGTNVNESESDHELPYSTKYRQDKFWWIMVNLLKFYPLNISTNGIISHAQEQYQSFVHKNSFRYESCEVFSHQ